MIYSYPVHGAIHLAGRAKLTCWGDAKARAWLWATLERKGRGTMIVTIMRWSSLEWVPKQGKYGILHAWSQDGI